jgi:hypothetical protein
MFVLMIYGGIDDIGILERSAQRQQAVAVVSCARAAHIETLDLWDELARLSREESLYEPHRGLMLAVRKPACAAHPGWCR